jgi:hypothetical protein
MITQALLKNHFEYKNGNLIWLKPTSFRKTVNSVAGTINKKCVVICIFGKNYNAHRLIYMYHFGFMPKVIDHIDGNPFNNHIENLRKATMQQNSQNSKLKITNQSGYKNVSWSEPRKKWRVRLMIGGSEFNFGAFEDVELADLVAQEARNKYFGNYAKHR